jgi:hypothetical protein
MFDIYGVIKSGVGGRGFDLILEMYSYIHPRLTVEKTLLYIRLFLNNRLFNQELPFKMGDNLWAIMLTKKDFNFCMFVKVRIIIEYYVSMYPT